MAFQGPRRIMTVKEKHKNPLADFTAKQREVLDLLIQHKTSKEISRILGISPHTVDQRIMLARTKLNVATRGEVAQVYRLLVDTYERSIYEESYVASASDQGHETPQEYEVDQQDVVNDQDVPNGMEAERTSGVMQAVNYSVLPEAFDGPYGTLVRLGFIAGIAVFLIVAVLGGLSMYSELARIVDY